MDLSIFYHGEAVGAATMEADGIYWALICNLKRSFAAPIRLYALSGRQSVYLGIPDAEGRLRMRIPKKHLPDGAQRLLASEQPNGSWKPWAGVLDGVSVEAALLKQEDGLLLALTPEEAVAFPQWLEKMEKIQLNYDERLLLRLDKNGNLPKTEKTIGGNYNETMDCNAASAELFANAFADDEPVGRCGGSSQGGQADCADL